MRWNDLRPAYEEQSSNSRPLDTGHRQQKVSRTRHGVWHVSPRSPPSTPNPPSSPAPVQQLACVGRLTHSQVLRRHETGDMVDGARRTLHVRVAALYGQLLVAFVRFAEQVNRLGDAAAARRGKGNRGEGSALLCWSVKTTSNASRNEYDCRRDSYTIYLERCE